MSNCGLTVTGTRTRYECFLRQLKAYGLVLYNILHRLFYTSSPDIRVVIKDRLQKDATRDSFFSEIQVKCEDISQNVLSTLVPYIRLMGLEERVLPLETNYLPALWSFFTRIIFEKPRLVYPDSLDGTNVTYLQESFQWFICEQVKTGREKKIEDKH